MNKLDARNRVAALAVYPGQPRSVHLTSLALPSLGASDVLIRVRRVGVCGTDREIISAHFGRAPDGTDELVIGHELLGVVDAMGPDVTHFAPGGLVSATVRRPDGCPACFAGQPDFCLWRNYTERGILGAHGFMAERIVEREDHLISIPCELEPVGVLLEPLSVVEKAVRQADLIQRRIAGWRPATALVLGAGPIGLLGTLLLRARDVTVYTLARSRPPTPASRIVEACGAHYVSIQENGIAETAAALPNIDLILEATGHAEPAFQAMEVLGNNGVLVLLSLTGGDARAAVPVDNLIRQQVLGNKVVVGSVNAAPEDFSNGVEHLGEFESRWPGLTETMITTRLHGFDETADIADAATEGIKTVLELP